MLSKIKRKFIQGKTIIKQVANQNILGKRVKNAETLNRKDVEMNKVRMLLVEEE